MTEEKLKKASELQRKINCRTYELKELRDMIYPDTVIVKDTVNGRKASIDECRFYATDIRNYLIEQIEEEIKKLEQEFAEL